MSLIPKTSKLLKQLKKYWDGYLAIEAEYRHSLIKLEEELQAELKEEAIGFVKDQSAMVIGIGSLTEPKKLKTVYAKDLEKVKDDTTDTTH